MSLRSPAPPQIAKKSPPVRVCVRVPPYARPRACAFVRACVQGKGAKGASNAGGACVRVPVRVCMRVCVCICAGVACVGVGVIVCVRV